MEPTLAHLSANGIDVAYFELGQGPLALCLHGYPDSAHTWRHLLPVLADAGFHAVAPFLRGYAPTGLASDGRYQSGVLGVDANALHEALGGDGDAVLIGHDWGAMGAYAGAHLAPDRWRRVVAAAVPPGSAIAEGFMSYDQLRLSWYMFFQLNPLSDMVVPMDDFDFVRKLWRDWSPGYDAAEDVQHFIDCMAGPDNVTAALSYYRQTLQFELQAAELAEAQAGTLTLPTQPLLYLHGRNDGCMANWLAEKAETQLTVAGSRFHMVEEGGHFLHLEQPDEVNSAIVDFVSE
jgi:pimeloyl-ACP methyl ester carboxylesterase